MNTVVLSQPFEAAKFIVKPLEPYCTKPNGLWFGYGSSWIDWVEGNVPHWRKDTDRYYAVDIDKSKFVTLLSWRDVRDFSRQYGIKLSSSSIRQLNASQVETLRYIDWARVMRDYEGLDVPMYSKGIRMAALEPPYDFDDLTITLWYDVLDCDSGCLWTPARLNVIREIPPIKSSYEVHS